MQFSLVMAARLAGCVGSALALACPNAARAETTAGTVIVNVGRLSYEQAGQTTTTPSNENRIVVAERLDVTLADAAVSTNGDGTRTVSTVLTNGGNGQEAFSIATAIGGAGSVVRVAYDTDGDGRYDPAHDAVLAGDVTPVLAPGRRLKLFAIVGADAAGDVRITATATTGAGPAGTGFANAGDGGGDAVAGSTGASASVTVPLATASPPPAPTLDKSATVLTPDGSSRAVRGARIDYTLVARFPTAAQGARVDDAIPPGTSYVPASLTLDATALSDAADTDPGDATPERIAVTLGDQLAGAVHTVRFSVIIQ